MKIGTAEIHVNHLTNIKMYRIRKITDTHYEVDKQHRFLFIKCWKCELDYLTDFRIDPVPPLIFKSNQDAQNYINNNKLCS